MPTSSIRPFDLSSHEVALYRDGRAEIFKPLAGPPRRIDGFGVVAPVMTRNPPHKGEMHPDGDELICLISGRIDVIVEEDGVETVTSLSPGQAVVMPRGTWHRIDIKEKCQLFVVTPGPGSEHKPL